MAQHQHQSIANEAINPPHGTQIWPLMPIPQGQYQHFIPTAALPPPIHQGEYLTTMGAMAQQHEQAYLYSPYQLQPIYPYNSFNLPLYPSPAEPQFHQVRNAIPLVPPPAVGQLDLQSNQKELVLEPMWLALQQHQQERSNTSGPIAPHHNQYFIGHSINNETYMQPTHQPHQVYSYNEPPYNVTMNLPSYHQSPVFDGQSIHIGTRVQSKQQLHQVNSYHQPTPPSVSHNSPVLKDQSMLNKKDVSPTQRLHQGRSPHNMPKNLPTHPLPEQASGSHNNPVFKDQSMLNKIDISPTQQLHQGPSYRETHHNTPKNLPSYPLPEQASGSHNNPGFKDQSMLNKIDVSPTQQLHQGRSPHNMPKNLPTHPLPEQASGSHNNPVFKDQSMLNKIDVSPKHQGRSYQESPHNTPKNLPPHPLSEQPSGSHNNPVFQDQSMLNKIDVSPTQQLHQGRSPHNMPKNVPPHSLPEQASGSHNNPVFKNQSMPNKIDVSPTQQLHQGPSYRETPHNTPKNLPSHPIPVPASGSHNNPVFKDQSMLNKIDVSPTQQLHKGRSYQESPQNMPKNLPPHPLPEQASGSHNNPGFKDQSMLNKIDVWPTQQLHQGRSYQESPHNMPKNLPPYNLPEQASGSHNNAVFKDQSMLNKIDISPTQQLQQGRSYRESPLNTPKNLPPHPLPEQASGSHNNPGFKDQSMLNKIDVWPTQQLHQGRSYQVSPLNMPKNLPPFNLPEQASGSHNNPVFKDQSMLNKIDISPAHQLQQGRSYRESPHNTPKNLPSHPIPVQANYSTDLIQSSGTPGPKEQFSLNETYVSPTQPPQNVPMNLPLYPLPRLANDPTRSSASFDPHKNPVFEGPSIHNVVHAHMAQQHINSPPQQVRYPNGLIESSAPSGPHRNPVFNDQSMRSQTYVPPTQQPYQVPPHNLPSYPLQDQDKYLIDLIRSSELSGSQNETYVSSSQQTQQGRSFDESQEQATYPTNLIRSSASSGPHRNPVFNDQSMCSKTDVSPTQQPQQEMANYLTELIRSSATSGPHNNPVFKYQYMPNETYVSQMQEPQQEMANYLTELIRSSATSGPHNNPVFKDQYMPNETYVSQMPQTQQVGSYHEPPYNMPMNLPSYPLQEMAKCTIDPTRSSTSSGLHRNPVFNDQTMRSKTDVSPTQQPQQEMANYPTELVRSSATSGPHNKPVFKDQYMPNETYVSQMQQPQQVRSYHEPPYNMPMNIPSYPLQEMAKCTIDQIPSSPHNNSAFKEQSIRNETYRYYQESPHNMPNNLPSHALPEPANYSTDLIRSSAATGPHNNPAFKEQSMPNKTDVSPTQQPQQSRSYHEPPHNMSMNLPSYPLQEMAKCTIDPTRSSTSSGPQEYPVFNGQSMRNKTDVPPTQQSNQVCSHHESDCYVSVTEPPFPVAERARYVTELIRSWELTQDIYYSSTTFDLPYCWNSIWSNK